MKQSKIIICTAAVLIAAVLFIKNNITLNEPAIDTPLGDKTLTQETPSIKNSTPVDRNITKKIMPVSNTQAPTEGKRISPAVNNMNGIIDPRISALIIDTNNDLSTYHFDDDGLTTKEISNDSSSNAFGHALKTVTYVDGRLIQSSSYVYYELGIVKNNTFIAYNKEGEISDIREAQETYSR